MPRPTTSTITTARYCQRVKLIFREGKKIADAYHRAETQKADVATRNSVVVTDTSYIVHCSVCDSISTSAAG